MRSTMIRASLCLLPLALLGCAADDHGLSLTVGGEGFPDGDVRVAATLAGFDEPVACEDGMVVDGRFEVAIGEELSPGASYRIDGFVDLDGDARCEFGVDAVMSIDLAPLDGSADFTFTEGATRIGDDPRGCASFGGRWFRVELANATRSLVRYALVKLDEMGTAIDRVVGRGSGDVDDALRIATVDLQGAGKLGHSYRIDLFEADTIDASCAADTVVWRISIGRQPELSPVRCTGIGEPTVFAHDLANPTGLEEGDCSGFSP